MVLSGTATVNLSLDADADLHELGHTCGLGHCRDPRGIMFFSNTLHNTDMKGPGFCAACREKVTRGVSG